MRVRKAYSMADVEDPAQDFATPRRIMIKTSQSGLMLRF